MIPKQQKLKHWLQTLARTTKLIMTEREFCKKLDIPWSTYQKDKSVLKTESFSMAESRLLKYAKAYCVKMEDILNYEINVVCFKTLYQTDQEAMAKRIAAEFGLS